jgi:hypothetical protein
VQRNKISTKLNKSSPGSDTLRLFDSSTMRGSFLVCFASFGFCLFVLGLVIFAINPVKLPKLQHFKQGAGGRNIGKKKKKFFSFWVYLFF